MKKNINSTFLILTLIFLIVGLTAVSATENNQTGDVETSYAINQENTHSNLQNQQTHDEQTIKSVNKKNNVTKQEINKKPESNNIKSENRIETTLSIKFINNEENEFSTENYLFTHMDEEYTLDITLTEDEHETPINGTVNLYLLDNPIPEEIILNNTGHIQKTYTVNKTGSSLTIYAEFEGNEQYNSQNSQTLYVDSEAYPTTLTLNEIENSPLNSTINITGYLYYKENIPLTNANINISLNNNQIASTTTDSNGKYSTSYQLVNLPIQDMAKIQVEYISSSVKYSNAFAEKYFDIEKISNIITVNNMETPCVGSPTTIRGQVIDENNMKYDGILNVKILNKENGEIFYTNDTVVIDNGEFSFNFTPKKALNHNLSLLIEENSYFTESYKNIEFNVEKAKLILNFEEVYESLVQDNVSIYGNLIDQNNNPMENIPITIQTDNEIIATVTTDIGGNFNFTQHIFREIEDDDFFSIYFIIEEGEDYESVYEETSYYLSKRSVIINLNTSESVKINKTIQIEGIISDAHDSQKIPSGNVKIFINNQEKTQIPIDSEGRFTSSINVNEDYIGEAKLYIEVYFIPVNPSIYYTDSFEYAEVDHEPLNTNIKVISSDANVEDNVNITIRLQDENKNNLNETISLTIRDSQFNEIYNNNLQLLNGSVETTFTPTEEGVYYLFAQYDGKENIYTYSTDELEISVEKKQSLITINPINKTTYVNNTITIFGQLTDNQNNPIRQSNVTVEIFNSTYNNSKTIQTNSQGIYNTTFTPDNIADNIRIRVSYDGNNKYHETFNETEFRVIKHNTTVNLETLPNTIKYEDVITIKGNVTDQIYNTPANGTINIKINDELVETITLENGIYQYEYTVKEVGNNILKIEFIENNAYNPSELSYEFKTTPLQTKIQLNPINDTKVNTKITVSGTINDENIKYLTANLTAKINNETLSNITANNGIFSFEYTPQQVMEYSITILYTGDNLHYLSSNSTLKFNTTKTQLSIENFTTIVDDKEKTVTVTGTIINPENISTENIEITIKIGEENYTAVINENGTFNITTSPLIPDTYPIKIEINQTEYFEYYNQNLTTVDIEKYTPIINVKQITNATFSIEELIEGNITDSYNQPLSNISLSIKIGNETYNIMTDDEGKFNKSINNFIAGINTISITVPETPYTYLAEYNMSFIADKQKSKIILDENTRIIPGDDISIKGKLLDNENKPIKNKLIVISVNNKNYTERTNEDGQFNTTINNAKVGLYKINVTFTDLNYESSYSSKTLNVTKLSVNLHVEDVISVVGEKITLRARLTDEYGNNVTGGNLVFKLNGRSLRMDDRFDTNVASVHKLSVINGIVEYTITADLYLRHGKNITASYSGSYKYENAKSNIAVASIKLRDAKLQVSTSNLIKQHDNLTFMAKIEDVTNNASNKTIINENASVFFKINGISIRNSEGNIIYVPVVNSTAKYNYSANIMASVDKDNNLRNYTVTAVYVNPNYYPNVRNNTYFNIQKSNVSINVSSVTLKGNKLSIKATLKDYLGYNLVGKNKLCVKINGITYKERNVNKYFTITDGLLNIDNINTGNNTIKNIEIVTGERQAYTGARIKTNDILIEE